MREAGGGAGKRRRRHERKREQPEQRHGGDGRDALGRAQVFGPLERHGLHAARELFHRAVEHRRRRVRAAPVGQVQERRQPVADGRVEAAGAVGGGALVESGQQAVEPQQRPRHKIADKPHERRRERPEQQRPGADAEPQRGFEPERAEREHAERAQRHERAERDFGRRLAPHRLAEPAADGGEQLKRGLAHAGGAGEAEEEEENEAARRSDRRYPMPVWNGGRVPRIAPAGTDGDPPGSRSPCTPPPAYAGHGPRRQAVCFTHSRQIHARPPPLRRMRPHHQSRRAGRRGRGAAESAGRARRPGVGADPALRRAVRARRRDGLRRRGGAVGRAGAVFHRPGHGPRLRALSARRAEPLRRRRRLPAGRRRRLRLSARAGPLLPVPARRAPLDAAPGRAGPRLRPRPRPRQPHGARAGAARAKRTLGRAARRAGRFHRPQRPAPGHRRRARVAAARRRARPATPT